MVSLILYVVIELRSEIKERAKCQTVDKKVLVKTENKQEKCEVKSVFDSLKKKGKREALWLKTSTKQQSNSVDGNKTRFQKSVLVQRI